MRQDIDKTKEELIAELQTLRKQLENSKNPPLESIVTSTVHGLERQEQQIPEDTPDRAKCQKVEEAFKQSEKRFRSMFFNIGSGAAIYEAIDNGNDFLFKDLNPAAETITKISHENAIGNSLLNLFPNMEGTGLLDALRRVWKTGQAEHLPPFYYEDDHRDGWRENRIYKLPSGEIVALFDDVTNQVKAQEALQTSEERLKLALEAVQDSVWDWDIKHNKVIFNDGWFTMLGYEPDEFNHKYETWKTLLHPDEASAIESEIFSYLDKDESFRIEFRLKCKDGSWKWVMGRGMVMERDEKGAPTRMIGTNVDISDSKATQKRYKKLMDFAPVGIFETDVHGDCSYVNKYWCEYAGLDLESSIGKGWLKALHPDDKEAVQAEWYAAAKENRDFRLEYRFLNSIDKTTTWLSGSATSITDSSGKILGYLGAVLDITDLKRMEQTLLAAKDEAESANKTKSEFLANMSHEIRTPLNGIMGMLQLLNLTSLDSEQNEYIDHALQSSKRLLRLLTDILDLSRVEAGKMNINQEPFDFRDSMDGVFQLFAHAAQEKKLDFNIEINNAIPGKLIGDNVRLQQILSNLVGNAIKFTNMGSIEVDAHPLPPRTPDEYRVLFAITDTGIGISDDQLERLFDPFTQVEADFTRKFQGAGLGLSITKRIIDLLGGNMAVESKEGIGSAFYFCIPFKITDSQRKIHEITSPSVRLQRFKILIAEDDISSSIVAQKILEKLGHQTCAVKNGTLALDKLRNEQFDIVLMDIQMPIMDGVEATQAIREGDAGLQNKDIHIIAMTAYAMAGDKEKFLKMGMDGYIAKPIDASALKAAIPNGYKL